MSLKLEGSRSRSVLVLLTFLWGLCAAAEKLDFTAAVLSYTYEDTASGDVIAGKEIQGFYGLHSRLESEEGRLVHVLGEDGANHGCSTLQNVPVKGSWIALIERGGCKFHDKIVRAAVESNASAVIVYDNEHNTNLLVMTHYVDGVVAVFIQKSDGEVLAGLVDSGLHITLNVSQGPQFTNWYNGTSVVPNSNRNNIMLMTTLTFLVLLIIGVIGLLIYAARRSKYIRNKNRAHMVFTMQETGHTQENLLASNDGSQNSNSHLEQM